MKKTTIKEKICRSNKAGSQSRGEERRREREREGGAREADMTGKRQENVRATEDGRMRGKRSGET